MPWLWNTCAQQALNKTKFQRSKLQGTALFNASDLLLPPTCPAHNQLLVPPSFAPQIGAYHTLDLELNQVFSIEKDVWDVIHLERIETSSDPAKKVCTASLTHAGTPITTPLAFRQTCTAS